MKKIFEAPEIKVSIFESSNILIVSGIGAKDNFDYSKNEYTVHSSWDSMKPA